jgi:hypothetical protein
VRGVLPLVVLAKCSGETVVLLWHWSASPGEGLMHSTNGSAGLGEHPQGGLVVRPLSGLASGVCNRKQA